MNDSDRNTWIIGSKVAIMEAMMRRLFLSVSIVSVLALFTGCVSPLISAVQQGDIRQVKTLLDSGANINEKSSGEVAARTPLIDAILFGHSDIVKLLVERGADINQPSGIVIGGVPLGVAAAWGKYDAVTLLVDKGADLEYALSFCEGHSNDFGISGKYKLCVATLKSIKEKRQPARPDITKEELAGMMQTAVEKASKTKGKGFKAGSSVQSDIEKPSFSAADRIMGDNDLAVVIGIEGYQNIPKSDFSYDDAKLMKEYATALGFKERNIELLTDERATKSSIEKTLEAWLKNKAKAESRVFVYYSGHGAPDPATGEAYLVPYDGDPNYLSVTGYPLKRLYDNLGKLQVAEVIIVLDSCFSGAGGRSVLAKGSRPLVMTTSTISIPSNIAVLSATQGTQISTSSPEKGHGVFTYHFLKALNDGQKTLSEIYTYIKPLVEDDAKTLNISQSPSISPDVGKLKGRFRLRK